MTTYILHKHHIVPKHAGGTDDPSNIIELTIEEHAEAHRILFEQYGRWQDELAWKGLSGQIGKDEIISKVIRSNSGKKFSKEHKRKISESQKGQYRAPASEETKAKMSAARLGKKTGARSEQAKKNMSDAQKKLYTNGYKPWNAGKKGVQICSEETRRKMSEAHLKRNSKTRL